MGQLVLDLPGRTNCILKEILKYDLSGSLEKMSPSCRGNQHKNRLSMRKNLQDSPGTGGQRQKVDSKPERIQEFLRFRLLNELAE